MPNINPPNKVYDVEHHIDELKQIYKETKSVSATADKLNYRHPELEECSVYILNIVFKKHGIKKFAPKVRRPYQKTLNARKKENRL